MLQDSEVCTICLESIYDNEIRLSCGHAFHSHCIQQWTSQTCPNCRQSYVKATTVGIQETNIDDTTTEERHDRRTCFQEQPFFCNIRNVVVCLFCTGFLVVAVIMFIMMVSKTFKTGSNCPHIITTHCGEVNLCTRRNMSNMLCEKM